MPFCVQCGAKLEDGAKFCTVCGAKQPEAASPVYVPPTEEKPAEPQGYSYTPPASAGAGQQSSYNYDPTIYGGAGGGASKPPKKKGGALVFIILAVLVVIGAVVYLVAGRSGGGSVASDDPVLGLYTAQKAETAGISISIKTMWKNGFTIELKDKGKAAINVDGKNGSAKWTLDGTAFTVKGSGVDCSGTLADGVLTLENVMDTGVTLYFTKDGAALPAEETPAPAPTVAPAPSVDPAPAPSSAPAPADTDEIVGSYNADKAVAYGMEIEISTMWEKGFSIDLKDGGKCSISVNGTNASGTWSQNGETVTVNVPGFNMDGSYRDGVLLFEDLYGMGVDLYFTKDGSMLPGSKPAAPALPAADSWWEGDWYGWWVVVDAGGSYLDENYVNQAWDACARIDVSDNGTGYIDIWDEDGDDVAWADLSFGSGGSDKGAATSTAGKFYNHEIAKGEWVIDPTDGECGGFDELICIRGRYAQPTNADNWIEYYIFLRPWGTRWEDIESGDTSGMIYPDDMMPLNYTDWYLPLIEAGKPMPDGFEGLEN